MNPVVMQVMVNRVALELRKRDTPGVKKIEVVLGDEKGTLAIRVTKNSIKHARMMVLDYPLSGSELARAEPAAHAARIARMIGQAEEVGPPIAGEARLAQVAQAAGRVH